MSKHLLYCTHFVNRTLTRSLLFVLTRLASCLIILIQAISPTQAAEVATRATGMNLIIALIFFLLSLTTAQAATYWAHPNGTSSNCAANRSNTDPNHANPANYLKFNDLPSPAILCMAGSDTLMLKPGEYVYSYGVWADLIAGTPSAYTTFKGSTGNRNDVQLVIPSWYAGVFDQKDKHRYIEFADLTFDGSRREGDTIHATMFTVGDPNLHSHITCLNDLDFDDCGGGAYIRFRNVKVDGGLEPNPSIPYGLDAQGMGILGCAKCEFLGGEWTRHVYGMYLVSEKNVIDGVWIHDNLLYGVQIFTGLNGESCRPQGCTWNGWELSHHQIIRNNLFQRNGKQAGESGGLCGNPDMVIGTGSGHVVYNNVYDQGAIHQCNPNGNDAIQISDGCFDCEFYNNTFTRKRSSVIMGMNSRNVLIKNNLTSGATGPFLEDVSGGTSSWTLDNNLTVPSSSFVNMTGGNWQLTSGSPAINTGLTLTSVNAPVNIDANGTTRPQGGAWDLGACERFSGAVKCPSLIVETPVQPPPTGTLVVNSTNPASQVAAPTTGWTFCASEYSPCNFSGTKEVRYGTNGVYVSKILTNGTSCNNNVFGDPVYGFLKQCEYRDITSEPSTVAAVPTAGWTFCASEYSPCNFSGTKEVRYGTNGVYVSKIFTNGVSCNNNVFGDPVYGFLKQCEYRDITSEPSTVAAVPTTGWTFCASEYSPCNFSGTKEVRYGTNGVYVSKILTNGTSCNNNVFGDPVYGFLKQCEYRDITSEPSTVAAVPTAGWTFCASEYSPCNFSGTKEVRYGTNGVYVSKIFTNGVSCNNNVFGDPVYGFLKQCEYRDITSARRRRG